MLGFAPVAGAPIAALSDQMAEGGADAVVNVTVAGGGGWGPRPRPHVPTGPPSYA